MLRKIVAAHDVYRRIRMQGNRSSNSIWDCREQAKCAIHIHQHAISRQFSSSTSHDVDHDQGSCKLLSDALSSERDLDTSV